MTPIEFKQQHSAVVRYQPGAVFEEPSSKKKRLEISKAGQIVFLHGILHLKRILRTIIMAIGRSKNIVIIPSHNVANVLAKTIAAIPQGSADEILVINDGSTDNTADLAHELGVSVVSHDKSYGYGAVQKTGYREAIKRGATYIVMVHGDNQYDPSLVPQFVAKLQEGYDVVTGSRMILGDVLRNGMPLWKYIPNRILTWLENFTFETNITDYHNGYRAFTAAFLERVPLDLLSDKFDFDTDILIQAAIRHARIAEIAHQTRYDDENSQMPFTKAVLYGLMIMVTIVHYTLHRAGIWKQKAFKIKTVRVG